MVLPDGFGLPLTRRSALTGVGAALAAPVVPMVKPDPGLNQRAMAGNRFFGTAVNDLLLADDRAYMNRVRADCGIVTGETAFKWGELRAKKDEWNWKPADAVMAFAARRSIQVRGHTMLWHEDNPKWLVDELTQGNAERLLTDHIKTITTHFKDHMVHWDVVNEVLDPKDGKPFGFRDTLWYRALGPALMEVAFHACAEAEPLALRFINDYGMEYTWPEHEAKRQAMLALLERMRVQKVPVQGLGFQAHLEAGVTDLDQARLAKFFADVGSLGYKIVITELDVRDNRVAGDAATRDAAVASHAREFLDVALDCPAVMGVLSWGLSDRRTWLNDEMPRDDKQAQRALPLDSNLQRKPLWDVLAQAFATAPARV